MSLVVPARLTPKGARCLSHPTIRKQGDQREQPQEGWCGSSDRQIRPLPLRLKSQMPAHLLEGYFQLPAHHEPGEDLLRIGLKVGTQEGLGFELSFGIAHQHPAHGHGEQACRVPYGRSRSYLDHALAAPVPVSDLDGLPNGCTVFGHLRKVGQPLTLYARPPYLPTTTWSSRLVEGGIQPEAGDEGHWPDQGSATRKQLQRGVGAVGYGLH